MRGLRSKKYWPYTVRFGQIATHSVMVFVKSIEAGVAEPGFIKQDPVDRGDEQFFYASCVIAKSVIGGVGNNGQRRFFGIPCSETGYCKVLCNRLWRE